MVNDGRRVAAASIPFSSLPDWPQWTFIDNSLKIEPDQVVLGTFQDRPAIIVQVDAKTAAACPVREWPEPILPVEGAEPLEELKGTDPAIPWLVEPKWNEKQVVVDMSPSMDLSILEQRYRDSMFGVPIEFFAKSALPRVRAGAANEEFEKTLTTLLRSPNTLDAKYKQQEFEADEAVAFANWKGDLQVPLQQGLKDLLERESQLQVVILMELLTISEAHEPLLNAHFDRLCIWQAVSGGTVDKVKNFCTDVLLPFYRSRLPGKVRQLAKTCRGVAYGSQKPRLLKKIPRIKPDVIAGPSQLALAQVFRSISGSIAPPAREPSLPEPEDVLLKANGAQKASKKGSFSRSMLASHRREVEVSFGRMVPGQPIAKPTKSLPVKRVAKAKSTPAVHVTATPRKARKLELPKEHIPLDLAAIDSSTDDDQD